MTHPQPPPDGAGRADLLPCPFCGAQPVVSCEPPEASDGYYVYCDTDRCPLNLEGWSWRVTSPEEARAMWNRRSRPASPAAEPWPKATGENAKGGWTLDFKFIERIANEVADSHDCERPSLETVEAVLLCANPAPPAPAGVDALSVIDNALETMELNGMHNESSYKALKGLYAALKDSGGGK